MLTLQMETNVAVLELVEGSVVIFVGRGEVLFQSFEFVFVLRI